jgi:type I restriction-modification system DNA methylase subunit
MNPEGLKQQIQVIIAAYNRKKEEKGGQLSDYSEANVRDACVLPLFESLGWDIRDTDEVDREHYTGGRGYADFALCLGRDVERKSMIFVETKRFGGMPEISERNPRGRFLSHDLTLDWTDEERQSLNYASKTVDVKWAILTNFEKFRLFNARTGETIMNIESPDQYLLPENLQDLLHLSKESVQNGVIDKLQFRLVREEIDINFLALLTTCRRLLANNIYDTYKEALEFDEIKRVVQKILDRLIIIRYAEDHWIGGTPDQLKSIGETWSNTRTYSSVTQNLKRGFEGFGRMYDSTIFEADEKLDDVLEHVEDELLGEIIEYLYRVSFRKFTSDILGNTYESYLGNKLLETKRGILELQTDYQTQKDQGIYYTPIPVVEYIVEKTVGRILKNVDVSAVPDIKVLDPACGSGSFLIKSFDFFVDRYERENDRFKKKRKEKLFKAAKKRENQSALDFDMKNQSVLDYERNIVKENLYGVDIDPQASEIASVNLVLKSIKPEKELPLILYENVKVGDSLLSWLCSTDGLDEHSHELEKIVTLRMRLKKAKDQNRREELEKKENQITEYLNSIFNETLTNNYFKNPEKIDPFLPFNWQVEFPEVFCPGRPASERGFDAVIGNPPWVSYGLRGVGKIPQELKEYYKDVFCESAEYKISTYALFMQKGISLLKENGTFGFIVPDSFLLGRFFSKVRAYILKSTRIREIVLILEDFWPHGTAGRSVILLLDNEKDRKLRGEAMMTIRCCKTLKDLEERNFQTYHYQQAYFETTSHARFRLFFTEASKKFVEKVEERSSPLCWFADMYSGCISRYGQESIISDKKVKEFIISQDTHIIYEDKNALDKWKPLLRSGSNIGRYTLINEGDYIYIEPDEKRRKIYAKSGFDLEKYTGEKLFLRQTGDSLVATFDDEGYFCLNNMHVVNLNQEADTYSIKYILALLNSRLMNFFYHVTSLEFGRPLAQIDIDMVKELPIREIDFEDYHQKELYDTIITNVDCMIVLNKQRVYMMQLFEKMVKKFRQNKQGYRPLTDYYGVKRRGTLDSPAGKGILKTPSLYGIDYLKSEELLDYREPGVVTSVRAREEGACVVVSVLLENKDNYADMIRIMFTDDLFKHFFALAIEEFIVKNLAKRKWSSKLVFEVLDQLLIPSYAKNREEDSQNIKQMMDILKAEYEIAAGEHFFHSPVKEFDLSRVNTEIAKIDREIDEIVYELYQLCDEETKLIEKSEYW